MSASALITWDGLQAHLDGNGQLDLVVASGAAPLLSGLDVVFDEPWTRVAATVTGNEFEQHWALDSVVAVVRQRFDDTWSLNVEVRNQATQPVQVPGCRLVFSSAWPVHEWFAGAHCAWVVEVPDSPAARVPAQLLALVQIRGEARADDAGRWLCGPRLVLGPAGTVAASHQVSWRSRWCAEPDELVGVLPPWWPVNTALAAGDEVILDLPDAALSSSTVALDHVRGEDRVVLAAEPGVHLVAVHEGRGTTDLLLAWAEPTEVALARRAGELLETQDARRVGLQQAWLVDRALARQLIAQDDAHSFLMEFCDRCEQQPASPQLAALLTHQASRTGDPGLTAAALTAAGALAPQVGAWSAWLSGLTYAQTVGESAPRPPTGRLPSDPVQRALAHVELELVEAQVTGADPSALVQRVARLLGPGLPGLVASERVSAQVWHLTGQLPQRWDLDRRWPVPLGARRDEVERMLIAAGCDDEALGWLVW